MELNTNIDSGDVKIKRTAEGTEVSTTEKPITKEIPVDTKQEPKEDLVTKVSKVEIKDQPQEDVVFNVNDIENIKDPEARKYAEDAYKSLQSGYTKKFQELAEMRKGVETKDKESSNWTTERVQEVLQNKSFVQAAQNVVGQPTDEYSALSETEKKQFVGLQSQMSSLVNQNAQLLKSQQDKTNKEKYANYNTGAVDIITSYLISGKVQTQRQD